MKDRETVTFHIPLSRRHIQLLQSLQKISKETGKPVYELLEEAIGRYLEEIKRECESLPDLPGRSKRERRDK